MAKDQAAILECMAARCKNTAKMSIGPKIHVCSMRCGRNFAQEFRASLR